MELLKELIKVFFALFLVYTLLYIVQWIVGAVVAALRLSEYRERRETVEKVLPDELACRFPVSVIIPAHNEDACICDTIVSLLEDDHPRVEIILVDDGSTDGTEAHVAEHFGLSPMSWDGQGVLHTQRVERCWHRAWEGRSLTLIRKENGGKADALNCGLNFSTAPYALVLDADTQVERGSLRQMEARFLADRRTVVCAGAVGNSTVGTDQYRKLNPVHRLLVRFQQLEYYRTFYLQRVLFDLINANIIVSGAFAMFDTEVVRQAGGYQPETIGEDMELTMRLHAFCKSQKRPYRIAYIPEARCRTQVPFHYRDYCRQRRRWHIGMIQSLRAHIYMLGSRHYGWAGVMAGTFVLFYELLAPVIELLGLVVLAAALWLDILNMGFALGAALGYLALTLLTQAVLMRALCTYGIEPLGLRERLKLAGAALTEGLFFHPLNIAIKIEAFFTRKRNKSRWNHIRREDEASRGEPVS